MGTAEHRIGRLVFQVAAPDRVALAAFGDAVRARFEALVVPALEAALDAVDRPGETIRLDRIEVDLGALDADAVTLGPALEAALRVALPAASRERGRQDAAAELAVFLETGTLPWAEPGRALAGLLAELEALSDAGLAALVRRLVPVLARARAAERLARQLPAGLVARILAALLSDAGVAYPGLRLAESSGGAEVVPEALVPALAEALQRLARRESLAPEAGVALAFALAGMSGEAAAMLEFGPQAHGVAARADEPRSAERPAPDRNARAEPDPVATQAVFAAGAVLLHPFLAPFFEQLDLLAAPGQFRDEAARARAVLLAHHLATGAAEAPEPETALFKLLCGMDGDRPLPRRTRLGETERGEARDLLTSVIRHWTRLGRTSPEGLREGFLIRPGRLETRSDGWRLLVERRVIDVLLDGLPWTLSRVRTPFMARLLAVDWR